jgi:chromosome segregation ATPase
MIASLTSELTKDRRAFADYRSESEARRLSVTKDVETLHQKVIDNHDDVLVVRKDVGLNQLAIAELSRKTNQTQEQHSGITARVNKVDKDISQLVHHIDSAKADVLRLRKEDLVRLSDLLDKLSIEKADVCELELKADKDSFHLKADITDLMQLTDEVNRTRQHFLVSLQGLDAKLSKKFTKLSDFTVQHLRHAPRDADGAPGEDIDAAGAGHMKCLVCDHPIKTVEKGSPFHKAKFYNTVD